MPVYICVYMALAGPGMLCVAQTWHVAETERACYLPWTTRGYVNLCSVIIERNVLVASCLMATVGESDY